MRLHDVTNLLNQEALSSKHVSIFFYSENMTSFLNYATATLRALLAWRGSYGYYSAPYQTILRQNTKLQYFMQSL